MFKSRFPNPTGPKPLMASGALESYRLAVCAQPSFLDTWDRKALRHEFPDFSKPSGCGIKSQTGINNTSNVWDQNNITIEIKKRKISPFWKGIHKVTSFRIQTKSNRDQEQIYQGKGFLLSNQHRSTEGRWCWGNLVFLVGWRGARVAGARDK